MSWYQFWVHNPAQTVVWVKYGSFRDVAQLGRALRSGRRGRWFESSHPDHFPLFFDLIGPICGYVPLRFAHCLLMQIEWNLWLGLIRDWCKYARKNDRNPRFVAF